MARELNGRLRVTGELVARTPLHVGGAGDDVDSDMPLARDGRGRFYVPGTSLAGALRAWCQAVRFDEGHVNDVWGYQEGEQGSASRVIVEDAALPLDAESEVRDGVGIDRVWGCAAEHIKFDRAVLPRGTRLPFRLSVELPKAGESGEEMVRALILALQSGEVRLGAAGTRGLGRVALENAAVVRDDLASHAGVLALLRKKVTGSPPTKPATPRSRPRLVATIDWRPLGPLMVKAGLDGVGVDLLPLVSGVGKGVAPVIPGSSAKGSLRGQAERIVRTLLGGRAAPEQKGKRRFLEHKDVPMVERLFGAAGKARREEDDTAGRGALGIDDCYANHSVPADAWRKVSLAAPDAPRGAARSPLREALDDPTAGLSGWSAAFHVAIDRWTGGAAEGALYTVLEPHGVKWQPLRLEIDPARLKGVEKEGLTLLLLTLRDLALGRIPLGFATHRGMGAVEVVNVSFRAFGEVGVFAKLGGMSLPGGDLAALPPELRGELNKSWSAWLSATREAKK